MGRSVTSGRSSASPATGGGGEARARRSPPGVASSRGWPSSARRCSSSRICTGPTTASSTSSTISSSGRPACRCSFSAPRRPGAPRATSELGRGQAEHAHPLARPALSDEETARLIAGHLSTGVLPAEMQQTLLRRAEGNPLFAEEYIRMLKDRGLLPATARRGGSTRPRRRCRRRCRASLRRGSTRSSRTRRRCSRLPRLSGRCSGLGSVAAIAGISPWDAEEQLHALERKELVRRDRRASVAGETEYSVQACARPRRRLRADSRGPAAPTSTSARPSGSSRSETSGQRIAPRCWPITT